MGNCIIAASDRKEWDESSIKTEESANKKKDTMSSYLRRNNNTHQKQRTKGRKRGNRDGGRNRHGRNYLGAL